MEDIKLLDALVDTVIREHSYDYKSFDEAKSTIVLEEAKIEFTYDRLSTFVYSHNLSQEGYQYFGKRLAEYFNTPDLKEDLKARGEYGSLLKLFMNCPLFDGYTIEKAERPDFVVTGEKKIGIEVTEFTTPYYMVLNRICKDSFGQGKTAEEIHKQAVEKHGFKANNYTYTTISGSAVVGTGLQDVNSNKDVYVDEILTKYKKYKEIIGEFDEFVILCDAEKDIEVTSQLDAEDIIDRTKKKCPEMKNCTVCILYVDSDSSKFIAGRFCF